MLFNKKSIQSIAVLAALACTTNASAALVTFTYESTVSDTTTANFSEFVGQTMRTTLQLETDSDLNPDRFPNISSLRSGVLESLEVEIGDTTIVGADGRISLNNGTFDVFSAGSQNVSVNSTSSAFENSIAQLMSLRLFDTNGTMLSSTDLPTTQPNINLSTIQFTTDIHFAEGSTGVGSGIIRSNTLLAANTVPSDNTAAVSEPASLSLFVLCLGLAGWARRKQQSA